MERKYVGTVACPQISGRDMNGHIGCSNPANAYQFDDHPTESYGSCCTAGHRQFFGSYYLEKIDQTAEEIALPAEVVAQLPPVAVPKPDPVPEVLPVK